MLKPFFSWGACLILSLTSCVRRSCVTYGTCPLSFSFWSFPTSYLDPPQNRTPQHHDLQGFLSRSIHNSVLRKDLSPVHVAQNAIVCYSLHCPRCMDFPQLTANSKVLGRTKGKMTGSSDCEDRTTLNTMRRSCSMHLEIFNGNFKYIANLILS